MKELDQQNIQCNSTGHNLGEEKSIDRAPQQLRPITAGGTDDPIVRL